jgi:hypothetical protein
MDTSVRDNYDEMDILDDDQVYDMYSNLAKIIAPALKRYKKKNIEFGSIPSALIEEYNDDAEKASERWNEVLDTMIYSFEEIANEGQDDPWNIWWNKNVKNKFGYEFPLTVPDEIPQEVKDSHKGYLYRVEEGVKLFGEYFFDLWL